MIKTIIKILALVILPLSYFEKIVLPFPIIQSTYHLLRLLSFTALIIICVTIYKNRGQWKTTSTDIFLLLFLFSLTTSSVFSNDPRGSLGILSHVYIAVINYFLFYFASRFEKKFITMIASTLIILNTIVGLLSIATLLWPRALERLWSVLLWENVFQKLVFDFGRNRIRPIGAILITSIIPQFYLICQKLSRPTEKILAVLLMIITTATILLSNYRNFILSFLIMLTMISFIIVKKSIYKINIKLLLSSTLLVIIIFSVLLQILTPIKVFNRFMNKEPSGSTIILRLLYARQALEIASKNIWLGIGPGNYQNYNSPIKTVVTYNGGTPRQFEMNNYLVLGPHNIFFQTLAESGIFGLISFSLILISFGKEDYEYIIRKNKIYNINAIIFRAPFWLFILISLFDVLPPYALASSLALRGIIRATK